MKLSLVFPSWFAEFGGFKEAARKVSTFPPLNLCLIAAIAQKAGWTVQLIDAHIEGLDDQAVLERVRAFAPDLIGLTAATPFYPNAVRLARLFKRDLGRPVIMGGPHVTYYPEAALDDGFDYVAVGECDLIFSDFLRSIEQGDLSPVLSGIMTRRNGAIVYAGPAPVLQDLDTGAAPARELLKNEMYVLGTPRGEKRYTSVQMARGCPFACVFCANDLYGKAVRRRSIPHVMVELCEVVRRDGVEHIYFVDDVLTLDRGYILALCDAILEEKLGITFEGSTRANLWDEELARRLQEAGLVRISFGLETADEAVRKIIKKGIPLESYQTANRINNRLGIETTNSVIIGLPGDTRETIERTVRYLCRQRDIQHVTLNVAIPYPGTEMLRMAERGEHGLRIVEKDFSKFQRYGSAVMSVGDLEVADLMRLQQQALIRIYLCWWRWVPIVKRFGIRTILVTAWHSLASLCRPPRKR